MFGNLLSNVEIDKLVNVSGEITFSPFYSERLQIAQYALIAKEIIYNKDGKSHRYNLKDEKKPYIFSPDEYCYITSAEHIILPEGIVGRFITASDMIEKGFGLTMGKLDPHYGEDGEEIRFGIKNLLNEHNPFEINFRFAYLEFYDLRALKILQTGDNKYREEINQRRRQ